MSGTWLVDGSRIATKIKSAFATDKPESVKWTTNPTKVCPSCQHTIGNDDVSQKWPGLPGGVKFDPTDQQIIVHLLAKVGIEDFRPHPFIDEFIPTVDKDDGICYTHPQKLPGVRQDGSACHFFHRAVKAYTTGTRKRRKIQDEDFGDVRWHKTGRTKPVMLDGFQRGCKKIMVLYMSMMKGGKAEKTNWVMHQYHLGTAEDEREGEYVISKIFYQQQQVKQNEQKDQELPENLDIIATRVDPVTPKSVTPEPLRADRRCYDFDQRIEANMSFMEHASPEHLEVGIVEAELQHQCQEVIYDKQLEANNDYCNVIDDVNDNAEEPKWWDSESQNLLDSQQLVEGLSLCDELLLSQSPVRHASGNDMKVSGKPCLADYAHLGPEDLKRDLEECQKLVLDPANIELDTPPEFRLSQLEFGSQESFLAWGVSK